MGRPKTLGACSVEGCGRAAVAKHLCALHYQRARKGLPLISAAPAGAPCSVPGCVAAGSRRVLGLCLFHYGRQRKGVDLAQPRQQRRERDPGAASPGALACNVFDCGRKVAAMGMCWGHYRRQLRGAPIGVRLHCPEGGKYARAAKEGPKNAPYAVRRRANFEWMLLEGMVTPEPNTGCLLWLGAYNETTGRPVLGSDRDPWGGYAYRAALWFGGTALERRNMSRHARHVCNNPGCVAADFNAPVSAHVVYGTAKENMADRTLRYERGELKPRTGRRGPRKLNESQVAYAWAAHDSGVTFDDLAAELGVAAQTVSRAVRFVSLHNQHSAQAA